MEELSAKKKQKAMDKALMADMKIDKEALKQLKKKLAKVESRPERGIETWYRLASKNLYTRLQLVDTKANILITANALIISVVLGTLYARLDEDAHLIFAVGGLIITNVISISYAILGTIPNKWSKHAKQNGEETFDLMTFDDFSKMTITEYKESVSKVLEDGNALYPSISTDIYNLGLTLSRKYKLIRTSYLVFLYGVIISVLLFATCHLAFRDFG